MVLCGLSGRSLLTSSFDVGLYVGDGRCSSISGFLPALRGTFVVVGSSFEYQSPISDVGLYVGDGRYSSISEFEIPISEFETTSSQLKNGLVRVVCLSPRILSMHNRYGCMCLLIVH